VRDWTLCIATTSLLASVAVAGMLTLRDGCQVAGARAGTGDVNPLQRSAAEAAESYLHALCAGRVDLADQLARGPARERLAAGPRTPDTGCKRRPSYTVDETHYGADGSVRLIGTTESRVGKRRVAQRAELLVGQEDRGWQVRAAHLTRAHSVAPSTARTTVRP